MNLELHLTITDSRVDIGEVWVHLKNECVLDSLPYKAWIPVSSLNIVFDPYLTKPETQPWSDFILSQVESLGTFIFSAYIDSMRTIMGSEKKGYFWVIATLDAVTGYPEGIELRGQAERFDPVEFEHRKSGMRTKRQA